MAKAQNPGNKMMWTDLSPDILMFHILPRLPAKCVGRFRCVSEEWQSFLTTPHFANLQLLHQNQDYHQHQKVLVLFYGGIQSTFRTIDCETPDKDGVNHPLPFKVDVGYPTIIGSLHGLVCIQNIWYSDDGLHTDLILWNPLTRDYKRLSKPNSYDDDDDDDWYYNRQFMLYYTTCDDDYKLLYAIHRRHPASKLYIYSLKSDSWRKLDDETTNYRTAVKCYPDSVIVTKSSVLLNDKLYFLNRKQIHYGEDPPYFIMMFDTKTEKLREIATPPLRKERAEWKGFMVVRSFIHLFVAFTDSQGTEYHTVELWRMNGSHGDWTKVVTYPPQEHHWKPLHIMRNGDWLTFFGGHVSRQDMNKPAYLHDVICRFESMRIGPYLPWKYMETLVSPSPNRYACHQVITPPSTLLN